MKRHLAVLSLMATAAVLLPSMAGADTMPSLKPGTFKPMFAVGPKHSEPLTAHVPTSSLTQWNGSFTDLTGNTVNFTQIGTDPSNTNTTTTVTVLLIPIKIEFTQSGKTYTFDPDKDTVKLKSGKTRTVIKSMEVSPLFQSNIDFAPQGKGSSCSPNCVDLGKTQYEDAFQRGTWWGNNVGSNTSYHVLFSTKLEKEQTLKITCSNCVINNPTGKGIVGTVNFGTFDGYLQTFMKNITDVNPGVLPLFITDNVFLTSGGCCIGGYHDADGSQPNGQTYSYATFETNAGSFSQDVSAFSHELGEWMDDPFVDNFVNCNDNGLMEVGDPLEREANYGGYPYKSHGFTYNLQSLVYMGYFGAPTSDSANQWYSFQDDMSHVCPGQ